ncbi:MAG: alanine--glyoxylate aminotransferase family protein [Bdellovibrionales bacterium]|nr:alanine--glyoxylate aminotransferase family protein [Bdellovibrionales bacterium]
MPNQEIYPYRLFAPGPVPLSEGVRQALSEPMIHHRSESFQHILGETLELLKGVFLTRQPVMLMSCAGSGAMEAAIVNSLSPGDEVLFINSGKFGERWLKMGKTFGLICRELKVEWGKAVQPETLRGALRVYPQLKAVFCQACETSTAVAHPIRELSEIIHEQSPSMLFVVDAMTAMGAMPLPMDDWRLDIVITGSQKAFMLPAGLAFIAFSERAWKAYEESRLPKFYFDLGPERKANSNAETRFSSGVSLIRALHFVLKNCFAGEGLERSIERSQNLARATRESFLHYGWQIYSESPSSSVTAAWIPEALRAKKIPSVLLKQFNLYVAGGQDELKGKIIRIGHLGYITDEDQDFFVKALGKVLEECQWPGVDSNKIELAVQNTQNILLKK